MSKVIIIDRCSQCQHSCFDANEAKFFCYEMRDEGVKYCPGEYIPDWCPLPDLPKRLQVQNPELLDAAYEVKGWNECLDAITGGDEK